MELRIGSDAHEQRLDRFLLKRFPNLRRHRLYELLRKKHIRLNGKKADASTRILEGDIIRLPEGLVSEEKSEPVPDFSGKLSLVFENDDILVAFKPRGLKTIPDSQGEISLSGLVQSYLREACTETFKPSPVSRLDRNTSGLVLFGKNYQSLKKLNALQRKGGIKKYYLALIFGTIEQEQFHRIPMKKDPLRNQVRVDSEGTMTETKVRPLRNGKALSVVEVELLTGKSHQIRVLLSHLGTPIVGDPKYGRGGAGQFLCAWRLQLGSLDFRYVDDVFLERMREENLIDAEERYCDPVREILL